MASFVIPAVGSLISGVTGALSAGKAAKQQREAAAQAAAGIRAAATSAQETQAGAFQGGKAAVQPFYNTSFDANQAAASAMGLGGGEYGSAAGVPFGSLAKPIDLNLPDKLNLQGFNPTQAEIQLDPGFDFRIQQAQRALERSAAAKGAVLGGGTLKALTEFAQNFASNEYSNAWNRALTKYNTGINAQTANYNAAVQQALDEFNAGNINQSQLFQRLTTLGSAQPAEFLANLGSNYANAQSNIGMNAAVNVGNLLTGAGAARAGGTMGVNNAIQGTIGGITNAAEQVALGKLLNRGQIPAVPNEPIYVPSDMTNYQYGSYSPLP